MSSRGSATLLANGLLLAEVSGSWLRNCLGLPAQLQKHLNCMAWEGSAPPAKTNNIIYFLQGGNGCGMGMGQKKMRTFLKCSCSNFKNRKGLFSLQEGQFRLGKCMQFSGARKPSFRRWDYSLLPALQWVAEHNPAALDRPCATEVQILLHHA